MSERGSTNGNARGSSYKPGLVRCYRCGCLLYNPDDYPDTEGELWRPGIRREVLVAKSMTVDRITPGCKGGTYRRNNIRPACGARNSETGGGVRRKGKS